MKHCFHFFTLAVLLLLNSYPALAQVIRFNKVTQVQEIPHDITGITQDREGNIWFSGTGISRYDGNQLKTYVHDPFNKNSIANDQVICITADKSGNIWAGTRSGLDKFDPKTGIFTNYTHNKNDSSSISGDTIICIIQDREGIIWLGTDMQGLNRLDPATGKFTHFRHKENDPSSISFDQVGVIYEDKKGDLWIGCGGPFFDNQPGNDGGLNRLDKKSGRFTTYRHNENDPHSLIDNRVRAILEDSHGTFWVGTVGDGLHTMNRDSGTFQRHTYDPKNPGKLSRPPLGKFIDFGNDHITFINEDITGNIWIGTFEAGLTKYDPAQKKITRYNNQNSNVLNFSDSITWCSFNSRDGVLWIGTWDNGLYWVDPAHQDIQHTALYTGRKVFSYFEEPGPVQYFGTDSGLVCIDKKNNSRQLFLYDPKNPESISDNFIFTLFKDSKNRIWVGTAGSRGGLNLYNPEKQSFTRIKHDPKDSNSLSSDFVFTVYEDRQSNLWVGTLNGLDKMNHENGAFTHYKAFPEDTVGQRNLVACILEDSKKNLWFGNLNEGGIHQLDKKTGILKNYLIHHNIFQLLEDSNGKLWACAEYGLYSYDLGLDSFSLFIDHSTGISINAIGIAEDNKNNLWLSSPLGLYRINKNRNEVSRFSNNFGLNPHKFNGFGIYTSAEGQMFINTLNGYYSFSPDKVISNLRPPEIVFTDFKVANQQVIPDKVGSLKENLYQAKQIDLSYSQDAFSFQFTVIHYSNPEANRTIYMLENYDKQWRNAGSERTAYYYNIPPGEYRFHVKAASSNGVWTEKSITILVRQPWWQSWWAFILYGCLLVGLALLINQTLKRRVIFKERERTRMRELAQAKEIEKAYHELKTTQGQLIQSEKMASLGELTAGIAHEIQNPLNFVNNFSEINAELIEDLEKEADKGNMQEVKSIAKDIKENSEKINHHGKRADSIVKGMLQHSKGNNAVKEPTDINKMADEYLRLAYHGFRAKDKTFNASMKTDFDESIGPITVIPQEIGRVFLNIINNAFYVVAEKKKQSLNGYEPTVSIQTKKKNGQVEIVIKDNGNGIPPKALDKIFQPFFTTKPTGQGTGLGLSLSYDIIKAHGGEINVHTKEGAGTEFIIQLPITT